MPRPKRPSEQLAPGEYEKLLEGQGGGCAICGATAKTRRLHVDHDHKTGAIRGLLCFRCNRFLHGWMTRDWLESAADYIDPPKREMTDEERKRWRRGLTERSKWAL